MSADFLDAHCRHMVDADTLFQASRLPNADQLFSFATECGLKKLMGRFGMQFRSDGAPAEYDDRVHTDKVWDRYETYRSTNHIGANYVLPSPNPFLDWNASQRYTNSGAITLQSVQAHKIAAETVAALIRKAQLEGLI